MNKTLLSAALIAGFGVAALAPQASHAATNTVTINGKILNATCAASVNGGTNGGTVTLPDEPATAFTAVGSVAGATPFTIALTGCPTTPSGVQVGAQFYSTSNADTATGTLKNTGVTGVDVQLLDSASAAVPVATAAQVPGNNTGVTDPTTLTGATANLNYTAQYYATAASVSSGTVSTNVNFVINYQ
ncbi:fimbrial protein [Rhodanobacter sp. DHG33]|uniref:fimbrial protein n=1 Tax=Rhodanobacter sp. DHG33 TaxID=2775921 RepID=UPI001784281C|nr:fimbrial protein [Rhodanobacter sp. DHG33]MBD8897749.1 type 1 fimbrial protein [Rhodanobacter sp. DHG33]